MDEGLGKIRDAFRECADMIDEIEELEKREEAGEDVKKEFELLMVRFTFKMVFMEELSKQI